MDETSNVGRPRAAGLVVAAGCLVVAATALPWVRYRVGASGDWSSLGAGPYAPVLVTIGALTVALALLVWRRPVRRAGYAGAALGLLGVAISLAAALTRMAHANDLTTDAGGETSYAVSAVVAVIAAIAVTAVCIAAVLSPPAAPIMAGTTPNPDLSTGSPSE